VARVILEKVTKRYGKVKAVENVSVEIGDGEFVTFLGPSGCGKTTSLRLIAGFIRPDRGRILIGERLVTSLEDHTFIPPEERNIGMVFQSYAVWPHMNVFENVGYPLKVKKLGGTERRLRVERAFSMVKLEGMGDRFPHQLSGGQQQRVALARALVMEPEVMLLDEPLSNLDAKLREEMRFEIKDLQRRVGMTVVYVTHDQVEAMAMSDRVVVMNQGVVCQIGAPEEIYENPVGRFVADFIGLTNFIPCRIVDREAGLVLLEDGTEKNYVKTSIPPDIVDRSIVSVRPNHIQFSVESEGKEGFLGEVERKTYLGSLVDIHVRVGDKSVRVQSDSAQSSLKVGDKVRLLFGRITLFNLDTA
jgi:iron(III) transport system ATP-binding protein